MKNPAGNPSMTPWFPADVKPVRPGIYQISSVDDEPSDQWFSHFDGKHWNGGWVNVARAEQYRNFYKRHRNEGLGRIFTGWRGLTSPTATTTGER